MKSTTESQCENCDKPINMGDDIVRVGNGLWTHEVCSVNSNESIKKNIHSDLQDLNKNLLESKINRSKSLKCSNCGSTSFLKPKFETSVLDEGGALTKKLYVCHKCSNVMQFVEKII